MRVVRWIKDNGKNSSWSRKDFERHFEGSQGLFNYCWRKWREYVRASGNGVTTAAEDVLMFLNDVASEQVNNPKSKYYLYG